MDKNILFAYNYSEDNGIFIPQNKFCNCEGGSTEGGGLTEAEVKKMLKDYLQQGDVKLQHNGKDDRYELVVNGKVSGYFVFPEDKHVTNVELTKEGLTFMVSGEKDPITVPLDFVTVQDVTDRINELKGDAPEEFDTLGEIATHLTQNKTSIETINNTIKNDIYTKSEVDELVDGVKTTTPVVPTKLSELQNDVNYATMEQVDEKVSEIEFPEIPDLSTYVTKTELDDMSTSFNTTISDLNIGQYETIEGANEKFQPKGYYVAYTINKEGRKVITFDNADIIGARANTEPLENKVDITGWVSLVQLNKWNVVDFGSPKTLFNINIPDGVRPTVQEASQSGPEANQIAYVSDVEEVRDCVASAIDSLNEIETLKDVIKSLMAGDNNHVTTADNVTKEEGNLLLSGEVLTPIHTAQYVDYTANNGDITAYNMKFTNQPASFRAPNGNILISDVTTDGSVISDAGKNNCFTIYGNGDVAIKNCMFGVECYNGVHMNNNGETTSTNVTVENVELLHTTNNGINVLATKDNAVVAFRNVTFGDVKNAFRLSNFKGAKGVVVNIENVNIDSVREKMILLEDYVKRTADNGLANDNTDLFKDMVFNIKECYVGGVKITQENILDYVQMVVGKPSLGSDIQVEYNTYPESFPTFVVS